MLKRSIVLLGLACCSMMAQAGTIELTPSQTNVNVGDVFTLNIAGADFTETVIGGGLVLDIDPSLVRLDSTAFNSQWDPSLSQISVDPSDASLYTIYFNTFTGSFSGNFDIATLTFTALQGGAALFQGSASAGFPFADPNANLVVPTGFGSANVAVQAAAPVPVPAAAWLLLSGLAVVSRARRRAQ